MKKKKTASIKHKPRRGLMLALAATVVMLMVVLYWASRSDGPASPPPPAAQVESKVPPFHASVEAAGPLPQTLSPDLFRNRYVARAYRLAGRIPEVLAQQPCYCWCDKFGHRSLLDCFATDHGAS